MFFWWFCLFIYLSFVPFLFDFWFFSFYYSSFASETFKIFEKALLILIYIWFDSFEYIIIFVISNLIFFFRFCWVYQLMNFIHIVLFSIHTSKFQQISLKLEATDKGSNFRSVRPLLVIFQHFEKAILQSLSWFSPSNNDLHFLRPSSVILEHWENERSNLESLLFIPSRSEAKPEFVIK